MLIMITRHMLKSYVKYIFRSGHAKGYGIHSPFVFSLVRDVIYDRKKYYNTDIIKKVRKEINKTEYTIKKSNVISTKYGELLFRLVWYFKPQNILEFGTSLGVRTMYLSMPDTRKNVFTIEKNDILRKIAEKYFKKLKLNNIAMYNGYCAELVPDIMSQLETLDFVVLDCYSKKEMLDCFQLCLSKVNNETIFIFENLYYSQGNEEAWRLICQNELVTVSIDMFKLGIVFFRKECQKQHFIVRY